MWNGLCLNLIQMLYKQGTAYTFDPSTWDTETGGSLRWAKSGLSTIALKHLIHSDAMHSVICMAQTTRPECEATMRSFSSGIFLLRFWVCECCVCVYVCTPLVCLESVEPRRGQQIPWNWSYRWLWVAMRMLRIKPRFSGKTSSALNHYIIAHSLGIFTENWPREPTEWCDRLAL